MTEIYYIGGSPCSGKSTIAEALSEKYNLYYFKVDDHLEKYMKMGASNKKALCLKADTMNPEQIWMRDSLVQCKEELLIYEEIFEFILEDLKHIDCKNGIITEGAAYLPKLVKSLDIPFERYISITPSKEFQIFHYSKREWVPYVLAECSNKEKAFENWMNRDVLFAEAVQQQCKELGYASLINNGELTVEELISKVVLHFGLG